MKSNLVKRGSVVLAVCVAAIEMLMTCIVVHDLAVPIPKEFSTRAAVAAIDGYREHVSPRLRGRVVCRFRPTCSLNGLRSVQRYGAVKGLWRTLARIRRCTRATPLGTYDPP